MTIKPQFNPVLTIAAVLFAAAVSISGCASPESQRLNIYTYAPVIDVKGEGYDTATYYTDLEECRQLGLKVQATYEEQRKKELDQATKATFAGILLGAITGEVIANNNDNVHSGRALTTGALYGGLAGAAIGSDAVDYERAFTKFGPTGIVDQCMKGRGYKILSVEGYGGG